MSNTVLKKPLLFLLGAAAFAGMILAPACKKEVDPMVVNGPGKAPVLPAQPYAYTHGNSNVATLGRVLFYDKALSLNGTISCGSCHQQRYAFADNERFSRGLFNGFTSRNSSAIISSHPFMSSQHHRFWDGRAGSTDTAVFMPVLNSLEMHMFDLNLLPEKLSQLDYYPQLFANAYGTEEINVARIREALALFVDNLAPTLSSKFDRGAMNAQELQGEQLFEDKGCYNCHNDHNFNGYDTRYQNIGLDVNYSDQGRAYVTGNPRDAGKFNVPTLRNIELTAPYMHDGRFNTLREVIDHYDHGVKSSPNLSWLLRDFPESFLDTVVFTTEDNLNATSSYLPVKQLNMSEQEKLALEAFLKALTDPEFVSDPKYSDPFR